MPITEPITEARGIPCAEALVGVESRCCEEKAWILVIMAIVATDLHSTWMWVMLISTEKGPGRIHQNVNRVFSKSAPVFIKSAPGFILTRIGTPTGVSSWPTNGI